ncbi:uncharacterized protein DDB_G0283697-like [Ptychodera flava]|uniref:uncharacterized protein DDB_G0283697-like n=1 Tax=Ptychodera flava TaxID=63121 RepID=UPI00396A5FBC
MFSDSLATKNGEAQLYDIKPQRNSKGSLHVSGTRLQAEIDRIDFAREKTEIRIRNEERELRKSLGDILDVKDAMKRSSVSRARKRQDATRDGNSKKSSDKASSSSSSDRSDTSSPMSARTQPQVSRRLSMLAEREKEEEKRKQRAQQNTESFQQLLKRNKQRNSEPSLGPLKGERIKLHGMHKNTDTNSNVTKDDTSQEKLRRRSTHAVVVVEYDPDKSKKIEGSSPFKLPETNDWNGQTKESNKRDSKESSSEGTDFDTPLNTDHDRQMLGDESEQYTPLICNDHKTKDRLNAQSVGSDQTETKGTLHTDQSGSNVDTRTDEEYDMSNTQNNGQTAASRAQGGQQSEFLRGVDQYGKYNEDPGPSSSSSVDRFDQRRRVSVANIRTETQPHVDDIDKQRRKSVAVSALDANTTKEYRRYGEMTEEEMEKVWEDVRKCRYLRGYDPPEMRMPSGNIDLFDYKKKGEKKEQRKAKGTGTAQTVKK